MKKVFVGLFAAILSVSVIGCKFDYSKKYYYENNNSENDVDEDKSSGYAGVKAPDSKKVVGDIVFNDGSATPYSSELILSDEQKEKAIAIIYKVDGSKSYGIGILSAESLQFCSMYANLDREDLSANLCTPDGEEGNWTFAGDTDGSDNFAKLKEALGSNDDTGISSNYPAFDFAYNYKERSRSHVYGTAYEDGWYLPTISELYDIYKEVDTVNSALGFCDGFDIKMTYYWSSSYTGTNEYTSSLGSKKYYYLGHLFGFCNGNIEEESSSGCADVCCIRVF